MTTNFAWVFGLTLLLLVASLGESWLPTRIVKLKQQLKERRNKRQLASPRDNNNNVLDSDNDKTTKEVDEERKRLSRLPWWEDTWSEAFMNSFLLSSSSSPPSSTETSTESEFSHLEAYQPNPNAQVLHFCFLLHGHRSCSTDLSYLQRVMQHHAQLNKRAENSSVHDMIVHCPVCNEGKTDDGVVNGGERMVQEILQVIRNELEERRQLNNSGHSGIQDITISIVGNSLGGIYGRYAIARLAQQATSADQNHSDLTPAAAANNNSSTPMSSDNEPSDEFPSCVLLDGKYRLHFNIFCTTASPHLGISKHTYVPLPRSVEIGAAHVLGETGRDLFRLNDVMKTMATCPEYLEPLRKFRKRVAYANAFYTDFPVPASTAAFLSDQSTYPHHFASNETTATGRNTTTNGSDGAKEPGRSNGKNKHIVATLHTKPSKVLPKYPTDEQEAIVDDLVQMSNSLDSLGWTKVFVDVRKEIPLQLSLPTSRSIRKGWNRTSMLLTPKILRRGSSVSDDSKNTIEVSPKANGNTEADEKNNLGVPSQQTILQTPASISTSSSSGDEDDEPMSAIHRLRQKGVVESRDVASMVSTPEDMQLSAPIGHNLMVALARDSMGGVYKGGRPVMDGLAKQLVQDIFDWNFQEESEVAEKTLMETQHDG